MHRAFGLDKTENLTYLCSCLIAVEAPRFVYGGQLDCSERHIEHQLQLKKSFAQIHPQS